MSFKTLFSPASNSRTLIIDSHKGARSVKPDNLHWINGRHLADVVGADLVWSYPGVNSEVRRGYDCIVFNHASPYSYVDYAWVEANPDARLFYITNEYNLGEPRALWTAVKDGRKYEVIANHPPEISKIVTRHVTDWHTVNLNALCFTGPIAVSAPYAGHCIYWGSYRKGREPSFKRFLTGHVGISTHAKNRSKFERIGCDGEFFPRVNWRKNGLAGWRFSLIIEDEINHSVYNHLPNRFYESLNYGLTPLFDQQMAVTIDASHYDVPDYLMVRDGPEVKQCRDGKVPDSWYHTASNEKSTAIHHIEELIQ